MLIGSKDGACAIAARPIWHCLGLELVLGMTYLSLNLELDTSMICCLHSECCHKTGLRDSLNNVSSHFCRRVGWYLYKLLLVSRWEYLVFVDEANSAVAQFTAIGSHLWRIISWQSSIRLDRSILINDWNLKILAACSSYHEHRLSSGLLSLF